VAITSAANAERLIEQCYAEARLTLWKVFRKVDEDILVTALHEGLMALYRWDDEKKAAPLTFLMHRATGAVLDELRKKKGRYKSNPKMYSIEKLEEELDGSHRMEVLTCPDNTLVVDEEEEAELIGKRLHQSTILRLLINGYTLREVGERVGLTEGRIAQIRMQMRKEYDFLRRA